jgi:protein SCO1/2
MRQVQASDFRASTSPAPTTRGISCLPDANGVDRSLADFRGKYVLLFFGYAQCPDVCPTALSRAVEVRRLLGPDGAKVQVVFVTVDPERDTPGVLREYLAAFDPSFIALRGTARADRQDGARVQGLLSEGPDRKLVRHGPQRPDLRLRHDRQGPPGDLRHADTAQQYADDLRQLMGTS